MAAFRKRMRARGPLLFLLACLISTAGAAWAQVSQLGGTVTRPTLPHAHDDRPITLGNTRAVPDASMLWETVDASDHFLNAIVTGSSDFVISQDGGVDWGVAGANRLRIQSTDSGSPLEWIGLQHDGTSGIFGTGAGDLILDPASNVVYLADQAAASPVVEVQGSTGPQLRLREAGAVALTLQHRSDFDQVTFGLGSGGGSQLLVTDLANVTKDHSIAADADPGFYVFGADDPTGPDTIPGNGDDPRDYGRLSYSTANQQFNIGSGNSVLSLGGDNQARVEFTGSTTTRPQLYIYGGNAETMMIGSQTVHAQNTISVDDVAGNQLVFVATGSQSQDCGHALDTDPTFYIHSDQTCSAAGANEWLAFHHNQTNAVAEWGEGYLDLTPVGMNAAIGVGLPKMANTVVAEPATCTDDTNAGLTLYVDDTNDGNPGVVCVCIATADDLGGNPNAWDWVRMDDHATACPHF